MGLCVVIGFLRIGIKKYIIVSYYSGVVIVIRRDGSVSRGYLGKMSFKGRGKGVF